MFEEKQFHDTCKEMRSIVTMEAVNEFIRLARNEECACDSRARDIESGLESEYIDHATKVIMKEAADKERAMALKWNALWAVFDHAEFYSVKN